VPSCTAETSGEGTAEATSEVSYWKLRASYLSLSKTENESNALSDETIFLRRSNDDEERGFTGVSSFLWNAKVLNQATHL
jgi:hypothetical protein